jgi:hypothetical protein
MPASNTDAFEVVFALDSTAAGPPYAIGACSSTAKFEDGKSKSHNGWDTQKVGTPKAGGASFTIHVVDSSNYADFAVLNWALTFIPKAPTTDASPFGNNVNTLTGSGAAAIGPGLELDLKNSKIKSNGKWDYVLMVQVQSSTGVKCFASDPEMEVGPGSTILEKK